MGLNPKRDLLPVAPAAHYTMGGVATDLDGRASLPGLYAVGECSCTGLHGANRLASNSLAECFVFGRRAALWRHAGLRRDAEGLAELRDDPYPLARLIAAACLAREESRGAHQRTDHPEADSTLDAMHTLVGNDVEPRFEQWK